MNALKSILSDEEQLHHELLPAFKGKAKRFYPDPEETWEPVTLKTGTIAYVLRNDPHRLQTMDRLAYLEKACTRLWTKLLADRRNRETRFEDMQRLLRCLSPADGILRIAQKPLGGYDVRAYAHDSWIFLELPTFSSIESGTDGINTTEDRRRLSIFHIVLHELAHVAGYWEHDDKHENCLQWLKRHSEM